jgi:hypothetical protein
MGSPIAGNAGSYPTDFVIPDDGDPRSASSVNVAFEALADRTAYLNARTPIIGSIIALAALTGMADGQLYLVPGYGLYVYQAASVLTADGVLIVTAAPGGRWIHENASLVNTNPGFAAAGLAGAPIGRIPASFVPNRIVAPYWSHALGAPFSTASTSFVDITGYSTAVTSCSANDLLVINGSCEWSFDDSNPANVADFRLVVVDGGVPVVLLTQTLMSPTGGIPFYGSVSFAGGRQVLNAGTVTVKCQVRSYDPSYEVRFSLFGHQASMSILHIRP